VLTSAVCRTGMCCSSPAVAHGEEQSERRRYCTAKSPPPGTAGLLLFDRGTIDLATQNGPWRQAHARLFPHAKRELAVPYNNTLYGDVGRPAESKVMLSHSNQPHRACRCLRPVGKRGLTNERGCLETFVDNIPDNEPLAADGPYHSSTGSDVGRHPIQAAAAETPFCQNLSRVLDHRPVPSTRCAT
jgi:hypothetical protein